ncbi:hypothetical protein IE53DRAFT_40833 [Violaceomyces palustris]|uniref:Uncharacterized protein n=1 Tax=Violaceomyces palustris TaxID=1673888 RepID=A0ACD0P0Y5_9BASI|nr:hypothetical protein IE53DRAFT_40833 [Violaceomyces palustris]
MGRKAQRTDLSLPLLSTLRPRSGSGWLRFPASCDETRLPLPSLPIKSLGEFRCKCVRHSSREREKLLREGGKTINPPPHFLKTSRLQKTKLTLPSPGMELTKRVYLGLFLSFLLRQVGKGRGERGGSWRSRGGGRGGKMGSRLGGAILPNEVSIGRPR